MWIYLDSNASTSSQESAATPSDSENTPKRSPTVNKTDTLDICRSKHLSSSHWETEPEGTPRVTQEKEQRAERLKRLGNAVVPLQSLTAFEYLMFG